MKLDRIVSVEWVDSCRPHGWTDIADLGEDYKPSHILTAGYLVREDDDCLIVASSQNVGRGGGQVDGIMCIPKVAILSRGDIPGVKPLVVVANG